MDELQPLIDAYNQCEDINEKLCLKLIMDLPRASTFPRDLYEAEPVCKKLSPKSYEAIGQLLESRKDVPEPRMGGKRPIFDVDPSTLPKKRAKTRRFLAERARYRSMHCTMRRVRPIRGAKLAEYVSSDEDDDDNGDGVPVAAPVPAEDDDEVNGKATSSNAENYN